MICVALDLDSARTVGDWRTGRAVPSQDQQARLELLTDVLKNPKLGNLDAGSFRRFLLSRNGHLENKTPLFFIAEAEDLGQAKSMLMNAIASYVGN